MTTDPKAAFLSRKKLLMAVAFLAILVAPPVILLRMEPRRMLSRQSCYGNLKQIDGSKYAWMEENHKTTNDVPGWNDLVGTTLYMRDAPVCPHGGVYTIGRVCELASCSNTNDNEYYRKP